LLQRRRDRSAPRKLLLRVQQDLHPLAGVAEFIWNIEAEGAERHLVLVLQVNGGTVGVDALEKRARALLTIREREDEDTYKSHARAFYDTLRAAWKRALEEVAFAHVIMRHRD
jgi:hypothetical protein